MKITIEHKTTVMWNLKRKHRVVVCGLAGKHVKTMWLNRDGSNRANIDAAVEKLK